MVILDQAAAGRSWLRILPPPRSLQTLVEHFWIEDSRGINARHAGPWRIVPDGSAHVIFGTLDAKDTVRHRLRVVGARNVYTDIDRRGRLITVGARLNPGALPRLIGERASLFTDHGTAMVDLFPQLGRVMTERLFESRHENETVQIFSETLVALARPPHGRTDRIAGAVRLIDSTGGNVDVQRVAEEVGYSPRTFRSVFAEHIGLTPKRYARIRRLHNAMHLAVAEGRRSWAQIASKSGYADQAHMARDFRALMGESPGAYLRRRRSR